MQWFCMNIVNSIVNILENHCKSSKDIIEEIRLAFKRFHLENFACIR